MSKYFILLTITLLLISNSAVSSKHDKDKNKFRDDHPVFGDGRKHPVHEDKVIGKYKHDSYKHDDHERHKESNTISHLDRRRINNLIETIDHLFDEREDLQRTKAKLNNAYSSSQTIYFTTAWRRYRLKIVNSQLAINRVQLIRAIDKLTILSANDHGLNKRIKNYNNRIN